MYMRENKIINTEKDKITYNEGYANGMRRVLEVFDDSLEEIDERIKSADPMDLDKALKIIMRHLGRLRE